MSRTKANPPVPMWLLKLMIHLAALLPVLNLYYSAWLDELGSDPVEVVIHFTGIGALNILLVSLTLSPLAKYYQWPWLLKVRRLIGLYVFFYAALHLLNFLAFEVQFQAELFVSEIFERPYMTVGMAALTILLLLAVTSIGYFKRLLGRKWQTLHNFTYLAVILGTIHFYWSVKSEIIEPSLYILITLILLTLRHKKLKRWFMR